MLENRKQEIMTIIEEIVKRETLPYGPNGVVRMGQLLTALREIVWRTTTHSNKSVAAIWDRLNVKTIDMEWLMRISSEFAFYIDWDQEKGWLSTTIARAISWTNQGRALPDEIRTMTGRTEDYVTQFHDNCWLTFIYLLSVSNAGLLLPDLKPTQARR